MVKAPTNQKVKANISTAFKRGELWPRLKADVPFEKKTPDRKSVPSENISSEFRRDIAQAATLHRNFEQNFIMINEDKLKLALIENFHKLQNKDAWFAPAGILLALFLPFMTSEIHDWILPADTWRGILAVLDVISAVWLLKTLRDRKDAPTINDIIGKIKSLPTKD